MIHDPTMAMIRTSGVGIEFYDRVMDRMAARPRRPQGVAVHFAGLCDGEINVVTIYRDSVARTDVFADFSGPEIANAQLAGPDRTDISREEFEIDSLHVADDLTRTVERPVQRDLFAFAHVDSGASTEQYDEAVRRARFPEQWPDGLLLHASCKHGSEHVVIDLWDSESRAADFYKNTIQPIADDVMDGKAPDLLANDLVIKLHSLTVTLDTDDPLRRFSKRSGAGQR